MPGQGVHQCPGEVAASGMHHQTCRFVHDQQVIVLVDYVQGDVLRNDFPVALRTVEHQGDDIVGLDLVVALYGPSVHLYESSLGSLLDAVAAGVAQVVHQELVHAHWALSLVGHHAAVLIQGSVCPGGLFRVSWEGEGVAVEEVFRKFLLGKIFILPDGGIQWGFGVGKFEWGLSHSRMSRVAHRAQAFPRPRFLRRRSRIFLLPLRHRYPQSV